MSLGDQADLKAGFHFQLGQNARDVRLHRALRDLKPGRDTAIGKSGTQEREDLQLAIGKSSYASELGLPTRRRHAVVTVHGHIPLITPFSPVVAPVGMLMIHPMGR